MYKLIIMGSILFVFAACKKASNQQSATHVPDISVARPIIKDILLTKDYPGYLMPDSKVDLVGRVSGTLQSSNYKAGTRVKKGQLIFVIEPTLYQNAVTQAEAELKTVQAQLEYAQNNHERMNEAIKSDAVSQIQVLQAEANLAEATAAVKNAEALLSTAQTNLSYCYVRAPFDGKIDLAQYDPGSYINGASQPIVLATMYKDDKMTASFHVTDNEWFTMLLNRDKGELNSYLSKNVTVHIGQDGVMTYTGKLDYLAPTIDISTGTLNIRAVLQNPQGTLKSGSYVSITLPYGEQKEAVLIPDASIATDQLGKYIYVVNDSNIVNYRHIEIGQLVDDSLRQVTKGLSAEEYYVTKALLKVREGMKINPRQNQ